MLDSFDHLTCSRPEGTSAGERRVYIFFAAINTMEQLDIVKKNMLSSHNLCAEVNARVFTNVAHTARPLKRTGRIKRARTVLIS